MNLRDIPVPDSSSATRAVEVLTIYSSESLRNHCIRSYLFAASLAQSEKLSCDTELLYVAAVLHDLGLVSSFDNVSQSFEEASAQVTVVFALGAGWSNDRATYAGDAIIAHMRESNRETNVAGYLLDVSTGLDISGRNLDRWSNTIVTEILDAYPRLKIADEFSSLIEDQAIRKPDSAAADAVRSGILDRIASNPLDQ